MPKHVTLTAFIISLVAAALVGAGIMFLTFQASPATFTLIEKDKTDQPSTAQQQSPTASTPQKDFKQQVLLIAACTTTNLQLVNDINHASLEFDAYATIGMDKDNVHLIRVKEARNFDFEQAGKMFDNIDDKNFERAFAKSITQIAKSIRDKCKFDNLFFEDSFFESFLNASDPADSTALKSNSPNQLSASLLLAKVTKEEFKQDPEGAFDKCMNEAKSGTDRLKCRLRYGWHKFKNWTSGFFSAFKNGFRKQEGSDGAGRNGSTGNGNGNGTGGGTGWSPAQCSRYTYESACNTLTQGNCTWSTQTDACKPI